jgi:glycosyltransferase involved in cell wall biosynthesis
MLFKEAKNVIGRTNWDRAHVWAVNTQLNYFHCNEVLRKEFYDGSLWSYERCVKHSIFLSQGNYPLKGIHKVIEALAIVKRSYPSVSVRIAGLDITCSKGGAKAKIKITTYGKIIKKLIIENELEDNVTFLGALNATGMKQEYLRSNVFICPSSIENSPNSLCEAQILGVPVLASYAGGIPDLMKGDEDHLYRFEEVEMLAKKICQVFGNKDSIITVGMKQHAVKRHDVSVIVGDILKVYNAISHK